MAGIVRSGFMGGRNLSTPHSIARPFLRRDCSFPVSLNFNFSFSKRSYAVKNRLHQPADVLTFPVPWDLERVIDSPAFKKAVSFSVISATNLPVGIKNLAQYLKFPTAKLEILDLRTGMKPSEIRELCEGIALNLSLKDLILPGNSLGDVGIEALANAVTKHPHIQAMHLFSNKVSCRGAISLATLLKTNKSIQEVFLWDNLIGDKGVSALGDSLIGNHTLKVLFLDMNKVTSDGCNELLSSLQKNLALESLHLAYNQLDDKVIPQLETLVFKHKNLRKVIIEGNHFSNPTELKNLLDLRKSNQKLEIVV